VGASRRALPFWLEDQGFEPTGRTVQVRGEPWRVFAKAFRAGPVELGVNALDRSAAEHYALFVGAAGRGPVTVKVLAPERARVVSAADGVSAALDGDVPVRGLPPELRGGVLVQVPRELRHATALARGKVWKTRV